MSVTSPNIYLFKVNNRNTRKKCEIYSKLTTKTPERPLMTSFMYFYCWLCAHFTSFSSASIVDFEQVNVSWDKYLKCSWMTPISLILTPFHPVKRKTELEWLRLFYNYLEAYSEPHQKSKMECFAKIVNG